MLGILTLLLTEVEHFAGRSELKQTLRATEETLGRTEAVLEATTTRLHEAEAALAAKDGEVARLEAKLQESTEGKEDRECLVAMLATEQSGRETLLKEKGSLLSRLEDSEAMVAAAVRSKDLAVAEIRTQVGGFLLKLYAIDQSQYHSGIYLTYSC